MGFPTDPTKIDVEAADLHAQLVALCKRLIGEIGGDSAWPSLDLADVEVKQIKGGISNVGYCVGPKDGCGAGAVKVFARVFGQAGDAVCDRPSENVIFGELSKSGFGPKLHGIFGNGRLEGWLEGRRPLEPLEMLQTEPVDIWSLNAARLSELHMRCNAEASVEIPKVWGQLWEWVALAKAVSFPNDEAKAALLKKLDPFPRFESELDSLEDILPSPKNGHGAQLLEKFSGVAKKARELFYEVKFCHLDLLAGNIMYSEEKGDVFFIDFEHAARSYVGLDVANHFCAVPESCLIFDNVFEADKYFPSRDLMLRWLKAYLQTRGEPIDDELLEELLKVVLDFALLAELRWVIWAIVSAGSSPVDFDYLGYAIMRFEDGYVKYKAWRDAGRRP